LPQWLATIISTTSSDPESSTPRSAVLRMQADRPARLRFAPSGYLADLGLGHLLTTCW
jgi:hypothetical protein